MTQESIILLNNENANNDLTLAEARRLINDDAIADEELRIIIEDLKILCEVAAHLYRKQALDKAA
jgi:hypothetical protein